MKIDQNRTGQGDVEPMLAALLILARGVDRRLFIEIGFARQREDSLGRARGALVGINMNVDRFRPALLTGPASDVRATGVNRNAVNVADDTARARILSECRC
ncbi:MAG TPA: hypothetical protein VGZ27_03585 [Vicinamibacterales bacterium]|nr:hypothetical protein [Vicinamibacterales bacterium]